MNDIPNVPSLHKCKLTNISCGCILFVIFVSRVTERCFKYYRMDDSTIRRRQQQTNVQFFCLTPESVSCSARGNVYG